MDQAEFLDAALSAECVSEVESALALFEQENPDASWCPIGDRPNNRGPIETSADPGRSLVERLTNGIDAVLEGEYERRHGHPECRSPKEAAIAWLGVHPNGLWELSPRERQQLANLVEITVATGEARDSRLVEVRDRGVGMSPDEMSGTILSLNESNKIQKHHLAGVYGQGGSSTFAISKYTLIVTKRRDSDLGFTLVRFLDLPPEEYKTGHYVYLTMAGSVLTSPRSDFEAGTLVKHFGYDLSAYSSPLGPSSVYGLLHRVLFDPVMPVWLNIRVHGYRRVIKGTRSALNGAVDEGDADRRGPSLAHNVPMFYVSLGDYGSIGIEYWVLDYDGKTKQPSRAYVDPYHPIVLTISGQNHAELSSSVVRQDAELSHLSTRLIAHVDSNSLTPTAKRSLFSSNREEARRGAVLGLIHDELVSAFRSDDELTRLNNEARDRILQDQDESSNQQLRREVAQLLRMQGLQVGGAGTTPKSGHKRKPRKPRPKLQPIVPNDPPTYARIVWSQDQPITMHAGQRRYVRIETDANSVYHDPQEPDKSRLAVLVMSDQVRLVGTTPLRGGRMRAILEADSDAPLGDAGTLRIELTGTGSPAVVDYRILNVVKEPEDRPSTKQLTLPPFDVRPVDGPDDEQWAILEWPDDPATIATSTEMESGTLVVYFSTVFPKYADELSRLERQEASLAGSFTNRYKAWLATHSLLVHHDKKIGIGSEPSNDQEEIRQRLEGCRIATLAAMFAAREATGAARA